jgi:hypothetical protein
MTSKICSRCLKELPIDSFSFKKGRPGQNMILKSRCKSCINELSRYNYHNPRLKNCCEVIPETHKKCTNCKQILLLCEFHPCCKEPVKRWHYSSKCKSCYAQFQRKRNGEGYVRPSAKLLEHRLIENKWKNAKDGLVKHGSKFLPFTIRVDDIRNIIKKQTTDCLRCPLTNIPIIDEKDNILRPSIDRINNDLGYTPENIRIVPLIYNLCRNKWDDIPTLRFICKIFKPQIYDWSNFVHIENYQRSHNTKNMVYTNPGSKVQHANSITEDDLRKIIISQVKNNILYCASTGVALSQENGPFYPSLDRINNDIGYIPGNIRYVARAFNLARNKASDKEVLDSLEMMRNSCIVGDLFRFGNIFGFADEWLNKENIFSNLIKHRNPIMITRPQKCQIKMIKNYFSSDFYDRFHYIGGCDAKFNIGVYYNDKLIACMSINRPSRLGSGDWELTRMACDFDIRIHGIWSFLINWIRHNKIINGKLVTFSDKRIFTGNVYNKMGFTKEIDVAPTHYWSKDNIRIHRSTLRMTPEEHVLGLSEKALRTSQGYIQVWDLGKTKWSMNI